MEFLSQLPFIYKALIVYLLIINILTIIIYGSDKVSAISNAWRVRERTLLLLALLGGSVGALVGIKLFRHKTRKIDFLLPLVLILLLQLILIIVIFPHLFSPTSEPQNTYLLPID